MTPAHRQLSKAERDGLFALLKTLEAMRSAFWKLKDLGWQPPIDIAEFDRGLEIIRALSTDTRSLVREAR